MIQVVSVSEKKRTARLEQDGHNRLLELKYAGMCIVVWNVIKT